MIQSPHLPYYSVDLQIREPYFYVCTKQAADRAWKDHLNMGEQMTTSAPAGCVCLLDIYGVTISLRYILFPSKVLPFQHVLKSRHCLCSAPRNTNVTS